MAASPVTIRWPNGHTSQCLAGCDWLVAARTAGVTIPTGCLGGSCGACEIEVNGQVVRVQAGEISLVSHPAVMLPSQARDSWTVEDSRDAFDADLGKRQFPIGPAAIEATLKPYNVPYKR